MVATVDRKGSEKVHERDAYRKDPYSRIVARIKLLRRVGSKQRGVCFYLVTVVLLR